MNLERMLSKCRAGQWSVDDLDWSVPAPALSADHEQAVVQYFTNMAGIERLAGTLFQLQSEKVDDPILREILKTFVVDEVRHSHAAQRLADHYDVHHFRVYQQNEHLSRFTRHFVEVVRKAPPDIATVYILTGELILDIALLRSLDDFVDDAMSAQAMRLINRDESRHIAIDYHMVEHYASDAYADECAANRRRRSPRQSMTETWEVAQLLYLGAPFFREVFFEPMRLTDPSGARIREAFKRMQLLGTKEDVLRRPFARFMHRLFELFNLPVIGPALGPVIVRIVGIEPQVLETLYTDAEARRARAMSFDELATEALGAKYA